MWNLYPFVNQNSGLTPPYAQTPKTTGSFPFYPPWAKPTGGTGLTPFNERFPATMPQQSTGTVMVPYEAPKLPAVRSANPLSGGGGLGAILELLRPLAGKAAVQGAKSFMGGPLATTLNALGMALNPTQLGAEPPLYIRDAQGHVVPNKVNPLVQLQQQPQQPSTDGSGANLSEPVPLPQSRPIPLPTPRPAVFGSVPLPRPRPQIPDATNYFSGPGAMNFGADGMTSGNMYGQGPGLLSRLFRN